MSKEVLNSNNITLYSIEALNLLFKVLQAIRHLYFNPRSLPPFVLLLKREKERERERERQTPQKTKQPSTFHWSCTKL